MPNIPDNTPLWLTILIFASMGVLVYMQTRNTTTVGKADATEKIGNAYDQLLENMQKRLVTVEAKLKKFEIWVPRLIAQIHELGGIPVDPPDTGELMKGMK